MVDQRIVGDEVKTINPGNQRQWASIAEAVGNTGEPVRKASNLTGIVAAAVVILAAFGLHVDDDTQNAMLVIGVAIYPTLALLGEYIRSKVTPVQKANDVIAAAYQMQPTAGEDAPKV